MVYISKSLWSVESAKAVKAQKYGALNAIMYLAPAEIAGAGNLCPHASPGCLSVCLGFYSGQASMVKNSDSVRSRNNVRYSRIAKAKAFQHERQAFMVEMVRQLARNVVKARSAGLKLVARPNGSSDIPFEAIKVTLSPCDAEYVSRVTGIATTPGTYTSLFDIFRYVQFVDYTKSEKRMMRFVRGEMPPNYHLTFSRSEKNEAAAIRVLNAGGNVAVVFDALPMAWKASPVIDGDAHDLRHLDPRSESGVVVGLVPKGRKAKRDASGFVVRAR